jgi:Intra-flagellar transport protein 57
MVDIEEESPDLINMEIDFGDKMKDETDNKEDDSSQEIISNILLSDIPPEEWQREVERVSSKLKIDYNNFNLNNSEWRSHLEIIKNHDINISKSIPDCRGILENMSHDIDRSLEKISKKESMISKNFINIVNIINHH